MVTRIFLSQIRFGHDADETCMIMDEVLFSIAERVKNFAVIYLVDITQVPDFITMYELYDPCTLMFFYRNKHIMLDLVCLVFAYLHLVLCYAELLFVFVGNGK